MTSPATPRALVTGGSSGIGLEIALELGRAGWAVAIAARDRERLTAAQELARREGLALRAIAADVTREADVRRMVTEAAADGPLTVCVNNVGRNSPGLLVKIDADDVVRRYPVEDWARTLDLTLTSAFLTGREAAAHMLAHGVPGVIVNIGSAARHGAYGQSAYAAAKAGMAALTRTWAVELAEHGIRVAGVAPGVVETEAVRRRRADLPAYRAYLDRLQKAVPLGRWAAATDVARAVLFVVQNDYITGTTVDVDGGGLPARV